MPRRLQSRRAAEGAGRGETRARISSAVRMNRRGMTMVELLMAGALGVLLGGVLLETSLVASNVHETVVGQSSLQMQLAAGGEALQRRANVAASAPSNSTVCGTGAGGYVRDLESDDGDGRATLILQVPSIDGNGQIIAAYYDCIIYDFQASTGILQEVIEHNAVSSRSDSTHTVAQALTRVVFTLDDVVVPRQMTATFFGLWTEGRHSFNSSLTVRSTFRNLV